jgi:hypothetical protein
MFFLGNIDAATKSRTTPRIHVNGNVELGIGKTVDPGPPSTRGMWTDELEKLKNDPNYWTT